jgi:hypothetical protein
MIGLPLIYHVWELLGLEEKNASELTPLKMFCMRTKTEGTTFETDSTRVHQIVKNCFSDSEAYAWVGAQQAKVSCGRTLLMALSADHYDVEVSMVLKRAQQVFLASIKSASWSHEYTFFDDLDRAKCGKKVEILLDGMKDKKAPDIVFAINSVRTTET